MKWVVLWAALAIMLGAMIYFKYWNFIMENINKLGMRGFEVRDIILPIGISFFPQLIAGPIVRFQDISDYLMETHREVNLNDLAGGMAIWDRAV